jgi:sRNA-binding protein
MASPSTIERQRGIKEAGRQLGVLREKWPLAFPVEHQGVRPLAMGVAYQIAEAMSWSAPYTLGVLDYWKRAAFYCRAVLAYDRRISLDGAPAEPVDAAARDLATKRLEQLAARNAPKPAATAKPKSKPKPPTDQGRAPLRRRA